MKKALLLLTIMALSSSGFTQEAETKTFIDNPLLPIYIFAGIIILIIIFLIGIAWVLLKTINSLTEQAAKEKAARLGNAYVRPSTWWDRITQRLNASVPVEKEKDIEMDHSYDGIRELDNHLPPWWKWLFYGTIGWSVVYIIAFHFSYSLPLSEEEYQNEVALAEEKARQLKAAQPEVAIDENTLVFTQDAAIIEKGKLIFNEFNCGSCHRNDGGGNTIGPNLTDEYWIHGGGVKNIFITIKNGAVEKGMPAWGKSMSPQAVRDVAFFIMSLQGTNPQNAKAPQGNIFKEMPSEKSDTTAVQAAL